MYFAIKLQLQLNDGPGHLVRIEGIMTGKQYTEFLEDGLFGTLND